MSDCCLIAYKLIFKESKSCVFFKDFLKTDLLFAMEQIVRLVGRKSCRILSSIIPPDPPSQQPAAEITQQRGWLGI